MRTTLPLALLIACGGGTDSDSGTTTGTPTGTTTGGTTTATVAVSGNISGWPGFAPAEGAQVCFRTGTEESCATTDAAGNYSLEAPEGATGGVRISHADLTTTWVPLVLGTEDVGLSLGVDTLATHEAYYTDAGVTLTPGHVTVVLQATYGPPTWQGEQGAVPTLTPASGAGPWFLQGNGSIDLAATSSTSLGVGLYLDVDPSAGPFTMDFGAASCDVAEMGAGVPSLDLPTDVQTAFFQFRCSE